MDSNERPIEIFAPFGEAFELTRKILFQPFDITKWFVIGFAAWLATFCNGAGFNYRSYGKGNWDWDWRAHHHGPPFSIHDAPPWVIPLILFGSLVGLALVALLLWLNSRGRFIFTDCIVRNRGAIAEPWREFREEGNRYFVFQIVVTLCCLVLFGGLAFLFVMNWYSGWAVVPLALLILFGVALVLVAIVVGIVMRFMVPVMYRRRCGAMEAFRDVWSLVSGYPGVFILFVLFYILLSIATAMIGCVAACVTCCIAALPYIGTVILLPIVMLLFTFPLCFLRQFGDQYDVWAVVRPTEPPAPPVPPVQESLPPA
jgi:hypothetical protein